MITTSLRAAATRARNPRHLPRFTIGNGPSSGAMVVMVVLGNCALAGCSDSGSAAKHGEGVGEAFATQALSVCASAQKSKDGWSAARSRTPTPAPETSDLPEVAVWLEEEVAPTFDAWRDELTALGTPPTGREAWAEVLTAVTRIADLNTSQVDAAKTRTRSPLQRPPMRLVTCSRNSNERLGRQGWRSVRCTRTSRLAALLPGYMHPRGPRNCRDALTSA